MAWVPDVFLKSVSLYGVDRTYKATFVRFFTLARYDLAVPLYFLRKCP
jgi:hypothetical protein